MARINSERDFGLAVIGKRSELQGRVNVLPQFNTAPPVMNTAALSDGSHSVKRIAVLDGWRALSILLVLAGHWLPLGPSRFQMNAAIAASGMALFFTLSGFLIVSLLQRDPRPFPFLVRRMARILPLAWLAMACLALAQHPDIRTLAANFLFYANLPLAKLMAGGQHLWSLCVEIQFYVLMALIVWLTGRRGLLVVPAFALCVTAMRFYAHEPISIVTWHRVDEILAGASLALLFGRLKATPRYPEFIPLALLCLLVASAHPATGYLQYARPYLAAATVGTSILVTPGAMARVLTSRPARYIAEISYALYVIHGMLTATWLGGEGASKLQRYSLRPLLALVTLALAHVSTFYYEHYWTRWARSWLARKDARI